VTFAIRGVVTNLGNTQFLADPLTPFTSGVAKVYRSTSGGPAVLDRPQVDMGMPRDAAAFIALYHQAENLGDASTEHINWDYGVDGATPSTDWGNIISGTLEIALASGAGVEGRSIQIRENWFGDDSDSAETSTATAVEILYRKKPASLNGWRFRIDVVAGANSEQNPQEDVITNLEDAEDNIPLQTFQPRPGGTTFYVDMRIRGWLDEYGAEVSPYEDVPATVTTVEVELREVL
jgi:hypothetical protein